MFRALIEDRFPDHASWAEEFGTRRPRQRRRYCWVFDPVDGTTNYAHGLPIFCSRCVARDRRRSRSWRPSTIRTGGTVHGRARRRRVAQRRADARLGGRHADRCAALTGFPTTCSRIPTSWWRCSAVPQTRTRGSPAGVGRDRSVLRCGRPVGRFLGAETPAWDVSAGALLVAEAGGSVTNLAGGPFDSRLGEAVASNGAIHAAMVETIQTFKAGQRSRNWTK